MKKILTVIIAAIITQSLTAQITRIKTSHDTTNDIIYDAVPVTVTVTQENTPTNLHSCSKFRIQIANDDRCLLGSKTRWVVGYVTTGNSTQYWDYWGTQIDKSKVISYTKLQRTNKPLLSVNKKQSTTTFDIVKTN